SRPRRLAAVRPEPGGVRGGGGGLRAGGGRAVVVADEALAAPGVRRVPGVRPGHGAALRRPAAEGGRGRPLTRGAGLEPAGRKGRFQTCPTGRGRVNLSSRTFPPLQMLSTPSGPWRRRRG